MDKNEKIVIAFLAGTAVGLVLGILFAPDKGSETRRQFSEEARNAPDGLQGLVDIGIEKIEQVADDFVKTVKDKWKDVEEES